MAHTFISKLLGGVLFGSTGTGTFDLGKSMYDKPQPACMFNVADIMRGVLVVLLRTSTTCLL